MHKQKQHFTSFWYLVSILDTAVIISIILEKQPSTTPIVFLKNNAADIIAVLLAQVTRLGRNSFVADC
jgi:hypothetical protein